MSDHREEDERRNVRLLFGAELTAGSLAEGQLQTRKVRRAVRTRSIPARPLRVVKQLQRRLGRLEYERAVADPLQTARRSSLGAAADAQPRFLVRVDEFPHYLAWDDQRAYGTERYRRFHEIMAAAGVPYLVAVLPRVSRAPLDPRRREWRPLESQEREMLGELSTEGVAFGLHGRDHRTRFSSPRRHSELCGLTLDQTERLLDDGFSELAPVGISPEIFVPPYNRFDARQYSILARRFGVVCGGPESIGLVGFHRTPMWRGESVYMPSYAPLYGHAREVLPAARRLIDGQVGLWAPIVLHWGWEADAEWHELESLLEVIAPYVFTWEDFLEAVRASDMPSRRSQS